MDRLQPLWYRNAVIYQVDVASFLDTDGDGWGDLRGVTEGLEHIRGLGANCIWLLPFYASPYRDGGYDVADHLSIDPRFGDVADFALLLDKADSLGLRVIIDLVPQHTSVDHPWFQSARSDPESPYRDFYVWADEPHDTGVEPVFPTVEDSVWAWDEVAQKYYRHTFYSHEPDLDLGNPKVRREIERIMAFWLRLGVSGFRVDAVPYIVERARNADAREDGLWLLTEMREFVGLRQPEAVLLGEIDVPVEAYAGYFGSGDRFSMVLDFWLNNHVFLALARQEAEPITRALAAQPEPPPHGQYATFLRNHDELDLERLTDEERDEVLDAFAPDDHMRAYGRGIRRRLAPMLGGDARRVEMAHALLMGLPGSPVILYGDEIGMGDDLSARERRAVRTTMQWSDAENGGFAPPDAAEIAMPIVRDGPLGPSDVNVHAQMGDPGSLLSRVGHLVRTRLGAREIGEGTWEAVDVDCASVLCVRYERDGRELLTAVNLSGEEVTCAVPRAGDTQLIDVVSDQAYPPLGDSPAKLRLGPYGYRWLRGGETP